MVDAAHAPVPAPSARPLEKREQRAGCARSIAEVKVIGTGIVVVDGSFDDAYAEKIAVESERAWRVGGHHRDVMKPGSDRLHGETSIPASISNISAASRPSFLSSSAAWVRSAVVKARIAWSMRSP